MAQGKGWGTETVREEAAAVRTLLGSRADDALTVLDVGANCGAWTLQALATFPHAVVHAFEPAAHAFETLTTVLGAEDRVTLHNVALGNRDGDVLLYADVPGSGMASLTRRRLDHFGLDFSHEEMVTVRTLESWSHHVGIPRIDVLKLDVEGHELDVLRGARLLLNDVQVVQFEFGGCNIDTRTYFQDFWYLLTGAGFSIHRLGPSGLTHLTRYSEQDEAFITTNFFASRR